ncbi:MAG: AAA family ATPase [Microthrixaceae bacterium]
MSTTGPSPSRTFAGVFDAVCENVGRVVHGKDEIVRLAVTCAVAGGHLLVEDVPGVGKTTLAKALARSIAARFGRVQFTPDLLPSDVVGSSVWNQHESTFEFRPGPIFANVLLGDEINRASPKTQSALLEAMAEEQVTVDGTTYELARPFTVIATQNPLEHQGTFPLPESQLDRFTMRLSLGYPARDQELRLVRGRAGDSGLDSLQPVATAQDLVAMTRHARTVHVADPLAAYVVDIADRSRHSGRFALGVSPRAAMALVRCAQVVAAAAGRDYATADDVKALAVPVLAHRVVVAADARLRGGTAVDAVAELLASTPVPAPGI